jgi:hypothetical protein
LSDKAEYNAGAVLLVIEREETDEETVELAAGSAKGGSEEDELDADANAIAEANAAVVDGAGLSGRSGIVAKSSTLSSRIKPSSSYCWGCEEEPDNETIELDEKLLNEGAVETVALESEFETIGPAKLGRDIELVEDDIWILLLG